MNKQWIVEFSGYMQKGGFVIVNAENEIEAHDKVMNKYNRNKEGKPTIFIAMVAEITDIIE